MIKNFLEIKKNDLYFWWQWYKAGYYAYCGLVCDKLHMREISKDLNIVALRELDKAKIYWKKADNLKGQF